jgi:hypothetical protein
MLTIKRVRVSMNIAVSGSRDTGDALSEFFPRVRNEGMTIKKLFLII